MRAHSGQKEESTGDDYILHVRRVVDMVDGGDAKAVAWLHDVVEDSDVILDDLTSYGMPDDIVTAVDYLTHDEAYTYAEYIDRIKRSGNALAVTVKLADLRDHLRPTCPASLRPRYEKAFNHLSQ